MPKYQIRWLPSALTLIFICYFWAIGLQGLDHFPKIHEDEAWQAAPGYTFWAEGYFGTSLFAGFYGMETNYYAFMPLFPIMAGAALHLFGIGLFQARLTPLILIILTLALTHQLGRKLFTPWHGTIAVIILVSWRIAAPFAHLTTGIPMVDVARITRYDSAVPLFGLIALILLSHQLLKKSSSLATSYTEQKTTLKNNLNTYLGYLLIGILIGLGTISHIYGAFWLPAIWLILVWCVYTQQSIPITKSDTGIFYTIRIHLSALWFNKWHVIKPIFLVGFGFGLGVMPWLIFVARVWEDFNNQYRNYSDRFGLFDFRFYLFNLVAEAERYAPIFSGLKQGLGSWLWLIFLSLSLGMLIYQIKRPHSIPKQILVGALVVLSGCFALLLRFKTFSYLATIWPLLALIIAWGFWKAWETKTKIIWWRPFLILCLLAGLTEGLIVNWQMGRIAQQTTSYTQFTETIANQLPPQQAVMGMHHYWLGLVNHTTNYRSIAVPIYWTTSQYVPQPVTFGEATQKIPPDIILLDQIMLDFLADMEDPENPFHTLGEQIKEYMADHEAILIGEVNDPTYGQLKIYQLKQP